MRPLLRLNPYFLKYRGRLLLGAVFIVLSNLFAVYAPRVVRDAFDLIGEAVALRDVPLSERTLAVPPILDRWLGWTGMDIAGRLQQVTDPDGLAATVAWLSVLLGVLYLVLALLKGFFMFLMRQTIIVVSRLIEYDLKNTVYAHYQQLDRAFYKRNSTGDLLNRISEDVGKVRMYLGPAVMYTINLVVLFVLCISFMLSVNVELTLYALAPLPLMSIAIYHVSNVINRRSMAVQREQSRLSTLAQESFSGIRVLKAYAKEATAEAHFREAAEDFRHRRLDQARVDSLFMPAIMLLIGVSTTLTIFIGGMKLIQGDPTVSVGNIAEFVIYVNMLTWPVTSIGWVASIIQQAEASQQRINEFLATEPELQDGQVPMEVLEGRIECRNMSFTYPDTGIEALKEVSFSLQPGQKMAVVGRTGSGKSTLAELLLRMYDVSSGELELDGRPIREWRLRDLRNQIGYVPQDVFLFSDTVAANIAFGHPEADASAIASFAEAAAVSQDIERLPAAYETLVGERGVTLSGGQKQRISLARALIKRPRLIILDDCLSAVDTDTEKQILQHLDEELRDASVLVITHRITSMMDFDHILVLDQGRVVEQGTHTELLERRGAYAELYELQLMESERESRS